jgi:enoyl-[acyl-carrier protein] reductase I
MLGLGLEGKNALVTGVADDKGLAWPIAKTLQAAGATVWLATHPRTLTLVNLLLRPGASQAARALPYGVPGLFEPAGVIPCDVEYDTAADIPDEMKKGRIYADQDVSIAGLFEAYGKSSGGAPLDVLVHSIGFSAEPLKRHAEVSRRAYLQALSVSSFSMIGLVRAALPSMQGREASVVGLSYVAAELVVADYGGAMATAKAALESDARNMAFFAGRHGHRVNIVSAGPFGSRAAKSIGDIDAMTRRAAAYSLIERPIVAQEVADAVAFLASPRSRAITAETVHVDCGFHANTP